MISTRGRYAVRILANMAGRPEGAAIPLREMAEEEDISLKYLESIMRTLVKAGIIEGTSGKGGGYRLSVRPEECRLGDVLRATEGDLAPTACMGPNATPCSRTTQCRARPVWKGLAVRIDEYLDSITIADLIRRSEEEIINAPTKRMED